MTKVVPVICPGCRNPIYSKDDDTVFLCQCGTLHSRDGKVRVIEYDVGAFTRNGDGEKVYLPFWKLRVNFDIRHSDVVGGTFSRIASFLQGNNGAGSIDVILPAFDMNPVRYKEVAKEMTLNSPHYTPSRLDPSISRQRCDMTVDMADNMADFLFVTIEAEKPGVLQRLDYDLHVESKRLLYLPYYRNGNDIQPGY